MFEEIATQYIILIVLAIGITVEVVLLIRINKREKNKK
jgi:hypothetical protein